MAVLTWKHGTTKAAALDSIREAVREAGYADSVTWSGDAFEARSGPFASVAHVVGVVTDDAVVIEKCGGLVGGRVLTNCRELLEGLFPGGERPTECAPTTAVK